MSRTIQVQIALAIALLTLSNLVAYEDRGELPIREFSDQFEVRILVDGRGQRFEFMIFEVAALIDHNSIAESRELGSLVEIEKTYVFSCEGFKDYITMSIDYVHAHADDVAREMVIANFTQRFEAATRDISQYNRPRAEMGLGVPHSWYHSWHRTDVVWLSRAIASMHQWEANQLDREALQLNPESNNEISSDSSVPSDLLSFEFRNPLGGTDNLDDLLFELGFCRDFRSDTLFEVLQPEKFPFRVRRIHCGSGVWFIFESRFVYDFVRITPQDEADSSQDIRMALAYFIKRFHGIENDLNFGRSRPDIGYRHPRGSGYREAAEVLSKLLAEITAGEPVR